MIRKKNKLENLWTHKTLWHTFTGQASSQTHEHTLTRALGQVAEETPEAGGEPLHALLQVSESLQITDVPQNLILRNQLITQIPRQNLWLLGKCRPVIDRRRNNEHCVLTCAFSHPPSHNHSSSWCWASQAHSDEWCSSKSIKSVFSLTSSSTGLWWMWEKKIHVAHFWALWNSLR